VYHMKVTFNESANASAPQNAVMQDCEGNEYEVHFISHISQGRLHEVAECVTVLNADILSYTVLFM